MSNKPFFTVITPVYNRAAIVSDSIKSVLNQDFIDFEYLIVDDGSSDKTVDLVNELIRTDKRVRLIALDSNKGRCFARNQGLKHAKGRWICYLDSDDLYYSNHLQVMKDMIDKYPDIKAFAVDQHINGRIKKYKNKKLHKDNIHLNLNDFIEDNPLTANQICHAASLQIEWSTERISFSEDWLFHRSLALKHTIFKKAIVTNNLIDHENRSMNQATAEKFVHHNLTAAALFINKNELPDKIKHRINYYTNLLCVNVLLDNNLKKDARVLFRKGRKHLRSYSYLLFYKAIVKFLIKI